ncbi:MAG TPA: hypothetical protein DEF41_11570 [Desulfovibrio sp.]|nr:hypothetical protein [Desulfovibrio sp.]
MMKRKHGFSGVSARRLHDVAGGALHDTCDPGVQTGLLKGHAKDVAVHGDMARLRLVIMADAV